MDRVMNSFPVFFGSGALAAIVMFGVIALAVGFGPARMSCLQYGHVMKIDVTWGLWTGCMIRLGDQLLPWSDVVPVQRGDKIVFEPKPYVRLAPPDSK